MVTNTCFYLLYIYDFSSSPIVLCLISSVISYAISVLQEALNTANTIISPDTINKRFQI